MTATKWEHLKFLYDHAGRPPILEAASKTLGFYHAGKPCIGHDLPPRTGKSTLMHILAVELQAAGAPFVHALVPWVSLARQLTDKLKCQQNIERVKAEGWTGTFCAQAISAIDSARYWQRETPTTLLASTIHLASHNSDTLLRAIRLAYELTGARPAIFVDEVHLVALGRKWADTLKEFIDAGAFVVTMTGTSKRADSVNILGFKIAPQSEWLQKNEKVVIESGEPYVRDSDGLLVRKNEMEVRQVKERDSITEATGVSVTWDVAFDAKWLHPVSPQAQDFEVICDGEVSRMKDVPASTAARHIGDWVRSTECCRQLAQKGVEALSLWRTVHGLPSTKLLAVTTSDQDIGSNEKQANSHAREMRRQVQVAIEADPILSRQDLCIEICTSVDENGEPDSNAAEKLRRFGLTRADKKGNTPIDILIVKGMGIVGLDVPECKVLLDASTVRKGPMKLQLATRILTTWQRPDGGLVPEAQAFYPMDPANVAIYSSLALASQGAGKERVVESCVDLTEEVEVSDPDAPMLLVAETGINAGYNDEAGKWAAGDYDSLIQRIYRTWPETIGIRKITLIEMYQRGAFPDEAMMRVSAAAIEESSERRFVDLASDLDEEREESFGDIANQMATKICVYGKDPARWREIVSRLQSKAKRRCRVSPDESVSRIQDPQKLRELKAALVKVFPEVEMEMKGVAA